MWLIYGDNIAIKKINHMLWKLSYKEQKKWNIYLIGVITLNDEEC